MSQPNLEQLHDRLFGEEDARACEDIPESACREQPRNALAILLGNSCTKIADELSSARVILPWLFGFLGAPALLISYLVPMREAGVLLPQLAVAALLRLMPRRKYAWSAGALLSGTSLTVLLLFLGDTPNWSGVMVCLLGYSLGRGICSVAAKDVLGKSVSKQRRGQLMGWASSLAGIATLVLGGILLLGVANRATSAYWLIGTAAALWFCSSFLFLWIKEPRGSTNGGKNGLKLAMQNLNYLRTDKQFRRFVLIRSGLTAVAMAPPFYILILNRQSDSLELLAQLLLATGLAAFISSPIWGRLADLSSRRVMMIAGTGAAGMNMLFLTITPLLSPVASNFFGSLCFLGLAIAHGGVRLGRKTWLVDYGNQETRAAFTAVANSVIGLVLLLAGLVGWIATIWSPHAALAGLSLISLIAGCSAMGLKEVSD